MTDWLPERPGRDVVLATKQRGETSDRNREQPDDWRKFSHMGTSMEMEVDNYWMEVKTMGSNCRINWTPVNLQICGRIAIFCCVISILLQFR